MRAYDDAHLTRIIRAKLEECGGNSRACDRALGLKPRDTYQILVAGKRICERVSTALGFRREFPGGVRVRPVRYFKIEQQEPHDIGETPCK